MQFRHHAALAASGIDEDAGLLAEGGEVGTGARESVGDVVDLGDLVGERGAD